MRLLWAYGALAGDDTGSSDGVLFRCWLLELDVNDKWMLRQLAARAVLKIVLIPAPQTPEHVQTITAPRASLAAFSGSRRVPFR